MKKNLFVILALVAIISTLAAQCVVPAVQTPEPTEEFRLAVILPGVITDADYNTLGYIGATEIQKELGIDMAYSESVAVPDVERVVREYIDDDYNIILAHGGEFLSKAQELAAEYPDVSFIAEGDAPVGDASPNLWIIDRNFNVGFYVAGAVAARLSQTGRIGYIGGLALPFSNAEVHAIEQAIEDSGHDVEVIAAWTGDFDDPTKGRELADAMIGEGGDVILGSLNLGMFGIFEAVKAAPDQVWVTAKYTDKTNFAPDHYVTSVLYDFAGPLVDIASRIMEGESGGYYPLGFDTGVAIKLPLQNVPEDLNAEIEQIIADIESGKIEVVENTEPIE